MALAQGFECDAQAFVIASLSRLRYQSLVGNGILDHYGGFTVDGENLGIAGTLQERDVALRVPKKISEWLDIRQ